MADESRLRGDRQFRKGDPSFKGEGSFLAPRAVLFVCGAD
jgi:hypothetical protein